MSKEQYNFPMMDNEYYEKKIFWNRQSSKL